MGHTNNLKIENPNYDPSTRELSFDVSWENAWYINPLYHDAAYVFIKYKASNDPVWKPALIVQQDQTFGNLTFRHAGQNPKTKRFGPDNHDGYIGGMIELNTPFQGDVTSTRITVTLTSGMANIPNPSFKVFGVEMVYVPEGSFFIGDGSGNGYSDFIGNPMLIGAGSGGVFVEATIQARSLAFDDQYPSGWKSFYMMKYEITQGQYKDFLNTLTRQQQQGRVNSDITGGTVANRFVMSNNTIPTNRNAVACASDVVDQGPITFFMDLNNNGVADEADDGESLAANYLDQDDFLAYIDWAGLRPPSSMEYEKAGRGFAKSVVNEYAWGSTDLNVFTLNDLSQVGTTSEQPTVNLPTLIPAGFVTRVGYAADVDSDRLSSGGSYFGIMSLTGNVAEWTVGIVEDIIEDRFDYGEYGSGELSSNGVSFVNQWNNLEYIIKDDIRLNNNNDRQTLSQLSSISTPSTNGERYGGRGVVYVGN